ncbi:MAG TPA: MFS transporter [Rhizomicrobium sp.]|nr:MFS transporter [Rhizomicrobium sp.]
MTRRAAAGEAPPNFLFCILYLPYGILNGYVTVTLAYDVSQVGATAVAVATLGSLNLFPQIAKFLWGAPLDTHLTYRGWYAISAALSGIGLAVMAFIPATISALSLLFALVLITSIANTIVSMTTDALTAHAVPLDKKGRASGWAQAGNVGGSGLGGGLGLWLAQHYSAEAAALALAVLTVACIAALAFVGEPEHVHREPNLADTLANIWEDVWSMARSRIGLLAMVLLLVPCGTGAASNLWANVAVDWHAGADIVAIIAGVAGGLVSTAGCLMAGHVCDLSDRKFCYVVSAALMAVCAILMAAAPRTPSMFVFFALLYALTNGFVYATFGAVMLEAIGRGAAATKGPILHGLTNVPVVLVTMVDGWAQTQWGSGAMLIVEGGIGFVGIGAFYLFVFTTRSRIPTIQPEAA